jgi:hypothetical protein
MDDACQTLTLPVNMKSAYEILVSLYLTAAAAPTTGNVLKLPLCQSLPSHLTSHLILWTFPLYACILLCLTYPYLTCGMILT